MKEKIKVPTIEVGWGEGGLMQERNYGHWWWNMYSSKGVGV